MIYWGMDSPLETSRILRAAKDRPGTFETLSELPGPAYYLGRNEAGAMYLGTTVEPGPAVRDSFGRIFGTARSGDWEEIHRCRNDIFPQYGIFYFPRGILPENFLVFSQRALVPREGCLTIARDLAWS